ncbi:MAG: hypothetical protein Q4G14_08805 [Paracoccus sp. (in: a-proteobacteria)]|uniref:hypothetical protein n=1 Tax=Paracoccus sp. TaxID=267 RepID=UPI0026E06062|nr:hypothetical protein [Paracoccus sp. (in: a-proteobacteria)]MDO5613325.1 hypothetical protein [Paracoccus sp. (in: a-proteobacteria)]
MVRRFDLGLEWLDVLQTGSLFADLAKIFGLVGEIGARGSNVLIEVPQTFLKRALFLTEACNGFTEIGYEAAPGGLAPVITRADILSTSTEIRRFAEALALFIRYWLMATASSMCWRNSHAIFLSAFATS